MSKYLRLIAVILMLLSLMILVPSGSNAEVVTLGLDEPRGMQPQEDCYTDWTIDHPYWEYEDPSISVRIEQGRMFNTDYWVAFVKIANPSQLRTEPAVSYYLQEDEYIEIIRTYLGK